MSRSGADQRGFTLIELMIGLVIGVVCTGALLSWAVFQNQFSSIAFARVTADETATLTEYILKRRISQAAGGAVKPWTALWVEDDCAARGPLPNCDHSDRVTVIELDSDIPECPLVAYNSGSGALESNQIEDYTSGPIPTQACCLTYMQNRRVQVSDENNSTLRFITSVNAAACTATSVAVQQAPFMQFTASGSMPNLTEGSISPVTVSTFFLDRPNFHLKEWVDEDNDFAMAPGEVKSIGTPIYDFQAAMGYDYSPKDGSVTDAGSTSDEWLYNAPGDVAAASGIPVGAAVKDLREFAFSLAAGQKLADDQPTPNSRFDKMNGPARDMRGWQLYGRKATVFMRNLRIEEDF